jgi:hypothetical protein
MKVMELIGTKINGIRADVSDLFLKIGAKTFMLAVLGLLLVFAITGIAVIAFGGGKSTLGAKIDTPPAPKNDAPLVFMHELLPPRDTNPFAQSHEKSDYRLFRPRSNRWTQDEAARWWTQTEKAMLDQLHVSNDTLMRTMLEASP